MSDLKQTYFAAERKRDDEADRLRRLDAFYAEPTQNWLKGAAPLKPGARVLEVGAGSGGMLAWLAERVGPTGDVLGLDMDLSRAAPPTAVVRHLEANIYDAPAEPSAFDLVYARLVLMHLHDPEAALARMIEWAKPGGTIAIADLDCTIAAPADRAAPGADLFDEKLHVVRAAMVRTGLMEPAFGARLPGMMAAAGLQDVTVERFDRIVEGGSDWSLFQAENNLLISGALGEPEAARIVSDFMSRPGFFYHDQRLVMVTGRKP
ncbi:MAG: methyltransferase domain-containing protein [Alphaproteobacteria bacterium]|nr:methyltransferase domain-containing protein [Alphaproteobacteria bacterium]